MFCCDTRCERTDIIKHYVHANNEHSVHDCDGQVGSPHGGMEPRALFILNA